MKIYYEIEKKAIFAPESYTLWPMDDPLARIVLYAPASQCFLLLLQNPDVVLSQKFLFAEVWEKNGLYVNANTLYQNIAVLRKTLKSIGIEEDVIKTVPRQGLKFTGQSILVQCEENSNTFTNEETLPENKEIASRGDEILAPAIDNQKTEIKKTNQFSPWLKKAIWLMPIAIIAFSLSLMYYSLTLEKSQTKRFFDQYNHIGQFEGCNVYSTEQNVDVNHALFSTFIHTTGLICDKGDSVWLTLNHQLQLYSAIKCNGDIYSPNTQCNTWITHDE